MRIAKDSARSRVKLPSSPLWLGAASRSASSTMQDVIVWSRLSTTSAADVIRSVVSSSSAATAQTHLRSRDESCAYRPDAATLAA